MRVSPNQINLHRHGQDTKMKVNSKNHLQYQLKAIETNHVYTLYMGDLKKSTCSVMRQSIFSGMGHQCNGNQCYKILMIVMQKSDKIVQNLVIFYKYSFFSRMLGSRKLAQSYLSTAFRNIRAKIFYFFQYVLIFLTKRQ